MTGTGRASYTAGLSGYLWNGTTLFKGQWVRDAKSHRGNEGPGLGRLGAMPLSPPDGGRVGPGSQQDGVSLRLQAAQRWGRPASSSHNSVSPRAAVASGPLIPS